MEGERVVKNNFCAVESTVPEQVKKYKKPGEEIIEQFHRYRDMGMDRVLNGAFKYEILRRYLSDAPEIARTKPTEAQVHPHQDATSSTTSMLNNQEVNVTVPTSLQADQVETIPHVNAQLDQDIISNPPPTLSSQKDDSETESESEQETETVAVQPMTITQELEKENNQLISEKARTLPLSKRRKERVTLITNEPTVAVCAQAASQKHKKTVRFQLDEMEEDTPASKRSERRSTRNRQKNAKFDKKKAVHKEKSIDRIQLEKRNTSQLEKHNNECSKVASLPAKPIVSTSEEVPDALLYYKMVTTRREPGKRAFKPSNYFVEVEESESESGGEEYVDDGQEDSDDELTADPVELKM